MTTIRSLALLAFPPAEQLQHKLCMPNRCEARLRYILLFFSGTVCPLLSLLQSFRLHPRLLSVANRETRVQALPIPAAADRRPAMALKHGILVFAACMFSFWVGVYINSLHDIVSDGPARLRSISRNFMDRISGPSSGPAIPAIIPPQHVSSYTLPSGHGPLVRLTDSLSYITGAPPEPRHALPPPTRRPLHAHPHPHAHLPTPPTPTFNSQRALCCFPFRIRG